MLYFVLFFFMVCSFYIFWIVTLHYQILFLCTMRVLGGAGACGIDVFPDVELQPLYCTVSTDQVPSTAQDFNGESSHK